MCHLIQLTCIYWILLIGVPDSTGDKHLRFHLTDGQRLESKVNGAGLDIGVYRLKTVEYCARTCVNNKQCGGFNYHHDNHICEIIPYRAEYLLSVNSSGWSLWKTEFSFSSDPVDISFTPTYGYQIEKKYSATSGEITAFANQMSSAECARICMDTTECNGFNYHQRKHMCEIIPYTMEHQLTADSSGWSLWLPGGCPNSTHRPDFTDSNYSVMIEDVPIIGSIYCRRDGNFHILAYLNLPAGPENNYLIGKKTEMTFSKYGVDLDTLTIRKEDYTFSSITNDGTEPLPVGYVDNCSGCYGPTTIQSKIKMDITGTQFKFGDGVGAVCYGYMPHQYYYRRIDQMVESHCVGCCGKSYVSNGNPQSLATHTYHSSRVNDREITLQLI